MLFLHKTTYLACANICHPTLPRLNTFAQHSPTIFPGLDTFARHLPTISPDSIHSLTFDIFEKNVTRLDTFARVIRHFGEFGASGHCLSIIQTGKFFVLILSDPLEQTKCSWEKTNKSNFDLIFQLQCVGTRR